MGKGQGMARKKAARSGAQKKLEGDGFEPELSSEMQRLLEADRDACADFGDAKTIRDAARSDLLEQMEAEGLDVVRCPFREKMIEREMKPKIRIRPIKEIDKGE